MSQIASHFQLNLNTLVQCRKQIGMTIEQVEKEIASIRKIETGEKRPTYKQLDKIEDLYQVPRWVFISKELPQEYQYINRPAFRKFKDAIPFENHKVRQVIARVEQYRDLFIELKQELEDEVQPFIPPDIDTSHGVNKSVVATVTEWLSISEPLDFLELKEKLAEKNIFIFLTSKYKGWAHVDQGFRGLTITHSTLPIIIINNSDSKKAQSFTLMHELGHLLRGDTSIDGENVEDSQIEKWCDRFAGEMLMPADSSAWEQFNNNDLNNLKDLAKEFKVSPYACLVRLKQLERINQSIYDDREGELKQEYEKLQNKLKNNNGGPSRNRSKEVCEQFGKGFVSNVLTSWHNQDMTLLKATQLLGLKRPKQLYDLDAQL